MMATAKQYTNMNVLDIPNPMMVGVSIPIILLN